MFTITVTRRATEKVLVEGAWTIIEKRPLTSEEFDKSFLSQFMSSSSKEDYATGLLKTGAAVNEVRGYAPSREEHRDKEEKVFEQTVDDSHFNLTDVIKAVNGLIQS
jgi:hypothetical protein